MRGDRVVLQGGHRKRQHDAATMPAMAEIAFTTDGPRDVQDVRLEAIDRSDKAGTVIIVSAPVRNISPVTFDGTRMVPIRVSHDAASGRITVTLRPVQPGEDPDQAERLFFG